MQPLLFFSTGSFSQRNNMKKAFIIYITFTIYILYITYINWHMAILCPVSVTTRGRDCYERATDSSAS